MNHSFHHRWAIGVILAFACLIRLHYVLTAYHEPIAWDQLEYTKLAIQLLEKGIYAYRDTEPNTLVTPGLPMFLAVIYGLVGYEPLEPALTVIRVLQCFLCLPAIWFLYMTGARLFQPAAGLLAALFAAVYPSYVWSTALILTEVPFLSSLMAMVYVQVRIIQENRKTDHLWFGLLLGITVLIRPNVLPLAVVPYLFLWFTSHRKKALVYGLQAAAAFALVMLPWWVRNWLTFHEFIFIAKGEAGNPFLGGTDPYFRGTIDWTAIDESDQMAEGLRRIKQGLIEQPLLWLKWMTVGKFTYFFRRLWVGPYPFYVPEWYYYALNKLHFIIVYAGLALLPIMGVRSRAYAFLAVSFAIVCGVHLLFIPVDRYAYGMLPFLMLGTAHAAVVLIRYLFAFMEHIRLRVKRFG
ncbi:ArnT family glycosyltransferase [Paenibacillus sp. MBLB4367]|uniref:ArnT family glycosyltransferase n=1 Tax=Paenibacillus sp. MBLB4367 TaxID=3384767 RepID=UPI0039081550